MLYCAVSTGSTSKNGVWVRGRNLNGCLELFKEQDFGTRWLWEFVNFRRTSGTLDILEFRKELAVVSEGAGYDLELGSGPEKSGKPRYKFMDCLTRGRKFIGKRRGLMLLCVCGRSCGRI